MGIITGSVIDQKDGKVRVETVETFADGVTVTTIAPNRSGKDLESELLIEKRQLEERIQYNTARIAEIEKMLVQIPEDLKNPVLSDPRDINNT